MRQAKKEANFVSVLEFVRALALGATVANGG